MVIDAEACFSTGARPPHWAGIHVQRAATGQHRRPAQPQTGARHRDPVMTWSVRSSSRRRRFAPLLPVALAGLRPWGADPARHGG